MEIFKITLRIKGTWPIIFRKQENMPRPHPMGGPHGFWHLMMKSAYDVTNCILNIYKGCCRKFGNKKKMFHWNVSPGSIVVCLLLSCASAQTDQGLYCPLAESLDTIECIKRQQRPGWDLVHVQGDVNPRITRMHESNFSLARPIL